MAGADFLGVGGPMRMKNMSRRTRSFARKVAAGPLAGARIFLFDSYGPLGPDPARNEVNARLYPDGGVKVGDDLVGRGLQVYPDVLRCLVTETKGPLAEDAPEPARRFARRSAADAQG